MTRLFLKACLVSTFVLPLLYGTADAMELVTKKAGVSVYSKAVPNAPALGTLKDHEKVEASTRMGMYWVVQFNGQKAYVRVADVQPARNSDVSSALKYQANKKDGENGGRARATAVMGIRGLDDSEDITGGGTGKPNTELTHRMENRPVDSHAISEIEKSVNAELEAQSKTAPTK